MDSLHIAQRSSDNGIDVARILIDRPSQTGTIVGNSGRQSSLQVDIVTSVYCLQKYSNVSDLPIQMQGTREFDPYSFVEFHKELENGVSQLCTRLNNTMSMTNSLNRMPQNRKELNEEINSNKAYLSELATGQEHRLNTGEHKNRPIPASRPNLSRQLLVHPETRTILNSLQTFTRGTDIFESIIEKLNVLSVAATDTARLKELAEDRLNKLYGCEKIWCLVEQITANLAQQKKAYRVLANFQPDNYSLDSCKLQLDKFTNQEPKIRRFLREGNQLLVAVSEVVCKSTVSIKWLEQLVKKLKTELDFISSLLDATKTKISNTHSCYDKLDKALEWSRKVMKLESDVYMDQCVTPEALELLANQLKSYINSEEINGKIFDEVSSEARYLSNKKLAERCKNVKRLCNSHKYKLTKQYDAAEDKKQSLLNNHEAESLNTLLTGHHRTRITLCSSSSQSAPATPALSTRCISNADFRRSISENDFSSDSCQNDCQEDCKNLQMEKQDDTEKKLEKTNYVNLELGNCTRSSTPADQSVISDLSDIQDELSSSEVSKDDCNYATIERGDKFLDVKHEIVIPIDENMNLNNNLNIESPTLENGIVKVFAPSHPVPAKRILGVTQTKLTSDEPSSPGWNESSQAQQLKLLDSHIDKNTPCQLSPILSCKQKQTALKKRRSYHGFTHSLNLPVLNFPQDTKIADSISRLSAGSDVSEYPDDDDPLPSDPSYTPQLSSTENSFYERENKRTLVSRRQDKSFSLVTTSTDSLPSLPEDEVISSSTLPRRRDRQHSTGQLWSPVPVNSHLMHRRVLPSTKTSSMADLRLTESEVKSRITLAHIMDELIQTERDYVEALRLVVEHYIPEMNRKDIPEVLRGKRGVIFGNIEKLFEFHNNCFLDSLSLCENEPFKISQYFIKHESDFLMYALYNKNKPKSDQLLAESGAFFKQKQVCMGDKLDLSSYLLKPVQRMGKYALILKQVLKECPESSSFYQDLLSAEEMIRFCLQHGNDLLAMDAIESCDVNLQEQGTLLLQEEFIVTKNRKKSLRHIFLFEQLLVFTKPKKFGAGRDNYVYKMSLKTSDLGLTENVGTSGKKLGLWFRKRNGESWTLEAKNTVIKNRWVNVIEKILWMQAFKNRETRLTELSVMGVGRKPCLDLKISEDNIKDRFIPSANQNSKDVQETRNIDDCEEISKKRPHSTISLGSSSSGSSGSGSTLRSSRRSLTYLDIKVLNNLPMSFTDKLQHSSLTNSRLQKIYRSDTRIHRSDSGISSLSDCGLSFLSPPEKTTN